MHVRIARCFPILLVVAALTNALPRLSIQGRSFVEAGSGHSVVLRGVSVTGQWWGGWVWPLSDTLEAHGLNPEIRYTRTVPWFLDSIDYANLDALGGNMVRYEFSSELFEPGNPARDSNLADVRQVVATLREQGKYTVLCLSGTPGLDVAEQGYQDTVPGIRRMKSVFESDSLERDWDSIWTWLATGFKGDSAIAAFELINEPRLPAAADISPAQCVAKYLRLCNAVRSIDPDRLFLIPEFNSREANPGETYSNASGKTVVDAGQQGVIWNRIWPLLPDSLPNVAMVFHWYDPWDFVNNAIGDFSASTVASGIVAKLAWPNAHNRPVAVTEYGADYALEMAGLGARRLAWFKAVHGTFAQNGLSTAAFTFKGEISPYVPLVGNYQLWQQYVSAASQVKAAGGHPRFVDIADSAAAHRNKFDTLLVRYMWKGDSVVPRSTLGSGPILDELHRYFSNLSNSAKPSRGGEGSAIRLRRRNGAIELSGLPPGGVDWELRDSEGKRLGHGILQASGSEICQIRIAIPQRCWIRLRAAGGPRISLACPPLTR